MNKTSYCKCIKLSSNKNYLLLFSKLFYLFFNLACAANNQATTSCLDTGKLTGCNVTNNRQIICLNIINKLLTAVWCNNHRTFYKISMWISCNKPTIKCAYDIRILSTWTGQNTVIIYIHVRISDITIYDNTLKLTCSCYNRKSNNIPIKHDFPCLL